MNQAFGKIFDKNDFIKVGLFVSGEEVFFKFERQFTRGKVVNDASHLLATICTQYDDSGLSIL